MTVVLEILKARGGVIRVSDTFLVVYSCEILKDRPSRIIVNAHQGIISLSYCLHLKGAIVHFQAKKVTALIEN